MDHRLLFVHGIGDHKAGYSEAWRKSFDRYLQLPGDSYVEVLWEPAFEGGARTTRGGRSGPSLTAAERREEERVRQELIAALRERGDAIDTQLAVESEAAAPARTTRGRTTRGILDWLKNPDEYLGDFVKYLVSGKVRKAVRGAFKEKIAPLADSGASVSVVSHSWGTVVSYDSLLDLAKETPGLRVQALVTLGSPLWLVRRFLENSSGAKPANVATWVNVTARGDKVGGWLEPDFKVDRDFGTPGVKGIGPHSSYFVEANVAVQRDLVTPFVKGSPA